MKWTFRATHVVLLLACAINLSAQTGYEPGYFIDNRDQRVSCSILNKNSARNPEDFTYKLPGESEARKAGIYDVKEFSAGSNTFVRFEGRIDVSSQNIKTLSESRDPEWDTQTIFLKLMENGKAKLYRYRNSDLELYFFSVDNSAIEQLVYKKVRITDANSGRNADVRTSGYLENLFYKSQLAARVSCGESIPAARMPAYQTSALQSHFEHYNVCNGGKVPSPKSNFTSLSMAFGWDFGTLRVKDDPAFVKKGSDKDRGYQIGIAGEIGLPFNNGKWTIVAQPTYQVSSGSNPDRHHKSIEIPAGVRHYFFFQRADVFLNGFVVPDFAIHYETPQTLIDSGIALSVAAGGGLRLKRLSVEGRYYFQRSYLTGLVTQYSKASIVFSFRLY